ncbi:MAG: terminus macrodomain insulation protein YfbV [Succinivibrio sp.]
MSIIKNIYSGAEYMRLWPDEPLLNPVFKENRVKRAMVFAIRVLPQFIVFILVWGFYIGGGFKGVPVLFALGSSFPVTLSCVLFLLFIPVHGYLWFYSRSVTPLNKKQKEFYIKICKRLEREPSSEPVMLDFEKTVNAALKKFGNEFLKEL